MKIILPLLIVLYIVGQATGFKDIPQHANINKVLQDRNAQTYYALKNLK